MWRNDTKRKYMFMFPLKNLARKGLKELMCRYRYHNILSNHTNFTNIFTLRCHTILTTILYWVRIHLEYPVLCVNMTMVITRFHCISICQSQNSNPSIILCMRPANERRRYNVNVVSHWLGAYTKWSLTPPPLFRKFHLKGINTLSQPPKFIQTVPNFQLREVNSQYPPSVDFHGRLLSYPPFIYKSLYANLSLNLTNQNPDSSIQVHKVNRHTTSYLDHLVFWANITSFY